MALNLNLLDINDDCLREIFKYLSYFELSDVVSTCNRFKIIAREIVWLRQKSKWVELNMESGTLSCRQQAAAFLRNFGNLCTALKVTFQDNDTGGFQTIIFNLMVKYCVGSLRYLQLINCNYLQSGEIIGARALFRNMKWLFFNNSSTVDRGFLSDAKQLTELSLINLYSPKVVTFLSNDYPQLQVLKLYNHRLSWGKIGIIAFLKQHRNLIELQLDGGGKYDFSSIGECFWLRKLMIWNCNGGDILPIAQLDKLTALKIRIQSGFEAAV